MTTRSEREQFQALVTFLVTDNRFPNNVPIEFLQSHFGGQTSPEVACFLPLYWFSHLLPDIIS